MNDQPTFPLSLSSSSQKPPLEYSLFSPSKALQQQRLAKDWTYIHQFLRQKYPFPAKIPKFEENEETLNALLALAAWNEKADEEWGALCRVEEMGVREMDDEDRTQSPTTDLNNTLLDNLTTTLSQTGLSTLTAHSHTSTLLLVSPSPLSLSSSLLSLASTLTSLEIKLASTTSLTSSLSSQSKTLESQLDDLQSGRFQAAEKNNLPRMTTETARQTKLLKAKIAEYDERLRNFSSASTSAVSETLLAEVEVVREGMQGLVQKIEKVEERIAVYEGVPPEVKEVRGMMRELREELESWARRRDELFEGLVDGDGSRR